MSPESILLAIVNALRPTGVAAVYALLSTRRPRRLLVAYIAAGFAWSFAVGILVVVALKGVKVETGSSTTNSVLSLARGPPPPGSRQASPQGGSTPLPPDLQREIQGVPSASGPHSCGRCGRGRCDSSAGPPLPAGAERHLGARPGLAIGTVNVLIFDAIWFAIPIAALAVALRHPAAARVALDRGSAWARRHERQLGTVVLAVVGVAFALKGAVALLN